MRAQSDSSPIGDNSGASNWPARSGDAAGQGGHDL
jgi:hypothetical protein